MSQDDKTTSETKSSKVRRTPVFDDSSAKIELEPVSVNQLEPIPESSIEELGPKVVISTIGYPTLVEGLIKELTKAPSQAVELVQFLGRITKGWEPIGSNGNPINEVPVPPGKNPRDFVRAATSTVHISGFRLTTIFGDEIATIMKDSPKWRVTVLGEYQIDTPFVQHSQRAEVNAKEFAESKLRDRGFIIGT